MKDAPRSFRPVTRIIYKVTIKVKQDRQVSGHDIAKELDIHSFKGLRACLAAIRLDAKKITS